MSQNIPFLLRRYLSQVFCSSKENLITHTSSPAIMCLVFSLWATEYTEGYSRDITQRRQLPSHAEALIFPRMESGKWQEEYSVSGAHRGLIVLAWSLLSLRSTHARTLVTSMLPSCHIRASKSSFQECCWLETQGSHHQGDAHHCETGQWLPCVWLKTCLFVRPNSSRSMKNRTAVYPIAWHFGLGIFSLLQVALLIDEANMKQSLL